MRLCKTAILMVLVVWIAGCSHFVHEYTADDGSNQNTASLTFTTENINKSRPYLLMDYSLQLDIYRNNPKLEKPALLATVKLTDDKKAKTIPIPAGEDLKCNIKYSSYVLGVVSWCETSISLLPVQNKSYTLRYEHEGTKCRASISDSEKNAAAPQTQRK
ncbi:MAG: hypothetical protein ABFD97_08725 [Syntrophobacter sp.]